MMEESTIPEKAMASSRRDVYVGFLLMALCAVGYMATTTFREVPATLSQNVPPTFFPRLVLLVMALLGGLLIFTSSKRPGPSMDTIPPRVWLTAGIFVIAVALVPLLGLMLTVALVALVLPFYWGERRRLRLVLLAVLLPAGLYVIFALGLGMRFPAGIFG